MLRAWPFGIELIHVAPGLEVDVMSKCLEQIARFGAYCATTCGVVINAENNDEREAGTGIVRLAQQT